MNRVKHIQGHLRNFIKGMSFFFAIHFLPFKHALRRYILAQTTGGSSKGYALVWFGIKIPCLLHSCVVASMGDLKLLARFGVLVLKSFLPLNMTLSFVKLGFMTPS